MDYVDFGRTGLKVSVAGLGGGGNSRLGLGQGKSETEAVRLIRSAFDEGVNFIDTAEAYGTEGVVGTAVQEIGRDRVIISTKSGIVVDGTLISAACLRSRIEQSLRALRTDTIDVFSLHTVTLDYYEAAKENLLPVLIEAKREGKIRHIGITEKPPSDHGHNMLQAALRDPEWEAAMFAFHMMNQSARSSIFPLTQVTGAGTMLMFVVRNIFSKPDVLRDNFQSLVRDGHVAPELEVDPEPLNFLIHETGAHNILDAAYRFARHEPGAHVTLFGTSSVDHVKANVASLLRPPLPEVDRARLNRLFGHLTGVGLDLPGPQTVRY